MKNKNEIEERITKLQSKLKSEIELYDNMSQIDMLSNQGNNASKFIYKTKGEINALKWVLNK